MTRIMGGFLFFAIMVIMIASSCDSKSPNTSTPKKGLIFEKLISEESLTWDGHAYHRWPTRWFFVVDLIGYGGITKNEWETVQVDSDTFKSHSVCETFTFKQ